MAQAEIDNKVFSGAIPALYEAYMVPLIFEPYALDLARRALAFAPADVLEIAAGTGVVTRQLALLLPSAVTIVASDLNQAMLDQAAAVGTPRPVHWQQADAQQLPFADQSFDLVVCQFGAMFFPDKGRAFAEVRRVLRPGGVFIFNVWDPLADNEFADTVSAALAARFPDHPPRFMATLPHGYFDRRLIEQDLQAGGFAAAPEVITLTERSRAASARDVALALCQGTPVRNEIEARDPQGLAAATEAAAAALSQRYGDGAVEGKIQAQIFVVTAS